MAEFSKSDIRNYGLRTGFSRVRFYSPGEDTFHLLPQETKTVIIAAMPYSTDYHDFAVPAGRYGSVAPFAWHNYYRMTVKKLQGLAAEIAEQCTFGRRKMRIFCNSRFPEKFFASSCGLGFTGRNSLIITPESGSLCVIGGLTIPIEMEADRPIEGGTVPGGCCSNCKLCMEACPTGAVGEGGVIRRDLCLQALTTSTEEIPEKIMENWGDRIYGCQICQEVCPYNDRKTGQPADSCSGTLGPYISLEFLLEAGPEEIKQHLKRTTLDMSWITPQALQRNACIAAANTGGYELENRIERFLKHSESFVRKTAGWAIEKLQNAGRSV
jgi:epoxyqueuosine reductase